MFIILKYDVFQELLSHPEVLQATLLRHMTSGLILSSTLKAGPTTVLTSAVGEVTVSKHPGQPFISSEASRRGRWQMAM